MSRINVPAQKIRGKLGGSKYKLAFRGDVDKTKTQTYIYNAPYSEYETQAVGDMRSGTS
jgi:hypothetical protein